MRIVSGKYGGRRLNSPVDNSIRPTSDKVRGAIFNALLSRITFEGAQVLDVFCGTGSLGLEALSRGASACIFVDHSYQSLALARENAEMLGAAGEFLKQDAADIGVHNGAHANLMFMDPPYSKGLAVKALLALHEGGWLASDCVCVIEVEKRFADSLPPMYCLDGEKSYGDTRILFLTYNS
jgi:16S rRNA (guanine966-N2)-methyltransferase